MDCRVDRKKAKKVLDVPCIAIVNVTANEKQGKLMEANQKEVHHIDKKSGFTKFLVVIKALIFITLKNFS